MSSLHCSMEQLEAGLDHIKQSPKDEGRLEHIVARPQEGERSVLEEGELDVEVGLVGDNWQARGNKKTDDGKAHPDKQINVMNARSAALVAGTQDRWALAGDQLYVDFDLSLENLPPGTRFSVGDAVLEVTPPPHRGCKKFVARFGHEAMRFVNSEAGCALNLRGINARVVTAARVRVGDAVRKL